MGACVVRPVSLLPYKSNGIVAKAMVVVVLTAVILISDSDSNISGNRKCSSNSNSYGNSDSK